MKHKRDYELKPNQRAFAKRFVESYDLHGACDEFNMHVFNTSKKLNDPDDELSKYVNALIDTQLTAASYITPGIVRWHLYNILTGEAKESTKVQAARTILNIDDMSSPSDKVTHLIDALKGK